MRRKLLSRDDRIEVYWAISTFSYSENYRANNMNGLYLAVYSYLKKKKRKEKEKKK